MITLNRSIGCIMYESLTLEKAFKSVEDITVTYKPPPTIRFSLFDLNTLVSKYLL